MGDKRMDPQKQFSKHLARWTAVFWFVYMTWLSVLMMLRPELSLYCFYMGIVSTIVMIVNEIAYTRNSIMEKMALTLLDKTRIELSMKNSQNGGEDESDEEDVKEGGSNG